MSVWDWDGQRQIGCPYQAIEPASLFWLSLYPAYKNGVLWCAGALRDQPYIYTQAMQVIDGEMGRLADASSNSPR